MIVFDLDDTILRINSHFTFSNTLFAKSKPIYVAYRFLIWGIIGKIVNYVTRNDARRVISFLLYRLYSDEALKTHSKQAFPTLNGIVNERVFILFEELKKSHKDSVIVITATPDFIADHFSNLLGVPVFGSKFDGKRITEDLLMKKCEYINQNFGKVKLIVSDNPKDLDCLSESKIFIYKGEIFKNQKAEEFY